MSTPLGLGNRKSLEPWLKDEVVYYAHQTEGIRQMATMKSFLLADDMGLGKSLQAITVFTIDLIRGMANRGIVVCPTSLKGNWADEFEKFTRIPHAIISGTPTQREAQLTNFEMHQGPGVLIMNYEQISKHLDRLNSMDFDVVFFDEAHYLKSPKSQRTKACHKLVARRSFLLTGTPMLNQANDLWSLLHRISPQRFPNYWGFINRFCVFGGFEQRQIVGVKNEKQLRVELQDIMIRRLKSEVLDLPEVQIIERRVDLTPAQQKLYDEAQDNLVLPVVGEADPMEIENALTKFLRLKQICGTTLPFTGTDDSAKLDLACEDDLELLANGEKIVVFTQFRDVQLAYVERMRAHGYPIWVLNGDVPTDQRTEVVKAWADHPGAAIICCMLQVAGVGLNMTAARHGSFLDQLFVPGLNQQAIDRLHRIGASDVHPVQIRIYIARGTVENRVQQILRSKTKLAKDLIEIDTDFKRKLLAALIEEEDEDD